MEVTEEPSKPPSKSETPSSINTLSLHSMFVGQDFVEKITKHTCQLFSLLENNFLLIFSTITYGLFFPESSPSEMDLVSDRYS